MPTPPDRSHHESGRWAVRCNDLTVRFGALTAVSGVSMQLPRGGIHALVGQNGAGKTTLARVLAGLQAQDHGTVEINGTEIPAGDHRTARRAGVDMVYQYASLVPGLTVAEALELWAPKGQVGGYRRHNIERRWTAYLAEHDIEIDVRQRVRDLPAETVQSIEIARADPGPGGLLILDEPTSLLAPGRVARLFEQLRAAAAAGVTVIIVLHKLAEVREVADTVSVMRRGRLALEPTPIESVDDARLGELIMGREHPSAGHPRTHVTAEKTLVATGLEAPGGPNDAPLRDVTLEVRAGEIVGVPGVAGNGQHTLVEVLAGLRTPTSGTVTMFGTDISRASTAKRRSAGLRFVPFDRTADGIGTELPLWQNVTSWEAERFRRWRRLPFLSVARMRREACDRLDLFGVVYSDIEQPAGSLSGGNMQRLILARELPDAAALIAARPTRGLDIGGTRVVWRCIRDLAAAGVPILVIASDLAETLDHSDRVVVLRGGVIGAEFLPPFDRARIGRAMTGGVL